MASPQTKNGFTKIANELLEEYIRITRFISPYENTMWLAILRKTYGFKKKKDWITLSQLEGITTIRQTHLSRTKKKLLEKNMIIVDQNKIGIQKDYDKWNIPKRVYTQTGIYTQMGMTQTGNKHTQMGNSNIPKQVDTKETLTKETLTKEKRIAFDAENYVFLNIKEKDREVWKNAFPGCIIDQELKKMIAWLLGDWPRRKKINYKRFITGWLSRTQDKGGSKTSTVDEMAAWAKRQAEKEKK